MAACRPRRRRSLPSPGGSCICSRVTRSTRWSSRPGTSSAHGASTSAASARVCCWSPSRPRSTPRSGDSSDRPATRPSPFRFALLAWNPVELWRRWGIYNRKLLLTLVYFPLGGNQRHRTRNVLLTFLASALLLHTGWFGSKYWEIGPAGWRDQTVYFLLQGLLVCGCLFYRDLRGARRQRADHALRWSCSRAAGTVATQAASALVHAIVLARALPFAARFGLI